MTTGRGELKSSRRHTVVICMVLAVLTLVFFRDTLLGNRVWSDGPSIFSAYPWKTHSPYRDVEQRIELDNARYYLPHQRFMARAMFERGTFPLWNPYILAGTPFFASANKHTLALTNLIYAFLDFPSAVNWAVAVQVFLSGLFMFIYLRAVLGREEYFPALAGALLFMFSGDLIERTFVLSIEELMWIPLALWALHRAAAPPFRLWPFAGAGLFLSLIYLGGHEFNTPVLYGLFAVVWAGTLLHGGRGGGGIGSSGPRSSPGPWCRCWCASVCRGSSSCLRWRIISYPRGSLRVTPSTWNRGTPPRPPCSSSWDTSG